MVAKSASSTAYSLRTLASSPSHRRRPTDHRAIRTAADTYPTRSRCRTWSPATLPAGNESHGHQSDSESNRRPPIDTSQSISFVTGELQSVLDGAAQPWCSRARAAQYGDHAERTAERHGYVAVRYPDELRVYAEYGSRSRRLRLWPVDDSDGGSVNGSIHGVQCARQCPDRWHPSSAWH